MPRNKFYPISISILCLLLGAVLYYPAAHAPFQFDDDYVIVENPALKSLDHLSWLWAKDPSRFLAHLTFGLNYRFGGLETRGYHLVNIFLHLLVTGLFYLFLKLTVLEDIKKSFDKKVAEACIIFSMLIFLCHPVQTESVTYICQRSTLLAAFFYLLALVGYLHYRLRGRPVFYFVALLAAGAGLFTKPTIITLPLAMILCEVFFLKLSFSKDKKVLWGIAPFALIFLVVPLLLILWRYHAFDWTHISGITRETAKYSRKEYLLTQFNVLMTYLRLFLVPVNQNLDYDYPVAKNFFMFPTCLSFLALVFLAGLAFRLRKNNKIISFSIFWFFVTLALESSVFPISDAIFEHRLYLPLIGYAIALPLILKKIIPSRKMWGISLCTLIFVYSVMTFSRNAVWADKIRFLSDVVKKSPHKSRAHLNLAVEYQRAGNFPKAQSEYQIALGIDPDNAYAHNNLANIYRDQGMMAQAEDHFRRAIELKPNYAAAYSNLGNLYLGQDDLDAAYDCYQKSLEAKPDFVYPRVGLAKICLARKNYSLAKFFAKQAIALDPDFAFGYHALGDAYLGEKNYDEALAAYMKAVARKPDLDVVYNNMGNIYGLRGDFLNALKMYRQAMAVNPGYAAAYFNIANTFSRIGRVLEAKRNFRRALELYERQGDKQMIAATRAKLKQFAYIEDR